MTLTTLLLLLAGTVLTALYLSPGLLRKILRHLDWSSPGIAGELTAARAVLLALGYVAFGLAVGFPLATLGTLVLFVYQVLAPR